MLAMQGLDMPGIRRDQYKMQIDVQQTLWDGGKSRTDRAIAESEAAQERMSTEVELTPAALSYHLKLLKSADLVIEYKQKNFIYYEINISVFEELILWVKQFGGNEE